MTLHRRQVLGSAAAAVLATVGAAARSPDHGAPARSVDGRVVLPGARDHAEARRLFQPRYDALAPGAVAHGRGHRLRAPRQRVPRPVPRLLARVGNAAEVDRHEGRLDGLWQDLRPGASGRAYRNHTDPKLTGRREAYYGPDLARLQAVRRSYDPDRPFRFPHAV
ncbi:BBE domain-containing protein [Streptomyces sp. NPDC054849]